MGSFCIYFSRPAASGVHEIGHRPTPSSRRRRRHEGSRPTEKEGRQDDRWGDHGETQYANTAAGNDTSLAEPQLFLASSVQKWVCFCLLGTIVSIGDPKKKYTRYEKIGQGWVRKMQGFFFSCVENWDAAASVRCCAVLQGSRLWAKRSNIRFLGVCCLSFMWPHWCKCLGNPLAHALY